jgi:hypothetical protein
VGEVECRPCPTVGVGEDWRLEAEDIVGQALVADDVCVHLGVFPRSDAGRRGMAPPIQPPSRRH